jgi:hypothetical protein
MRFSEPIELTMVLGRGDDQDTEWSMPVGPSIFDQSHSIRFGKGLHKSHQLMVIEMPVADGEAKILVGGNDAFPVGVFTQVILQIGTRGYGR